MSDSPSSRKKQSLVAIFHGALLCSGGRRPAERQGAFVDPRRVTSSAANRPLRADERI
jgi:hypothetical protein